MAAFGGLLQTLVAFIVVLGVLIVVHEYGHYLAARLCGVKVLRFCVGFGRPLWSKRFKEDGTEWAVAAFPLGGYVKMLDEREGEVAAAELPFAFNRQVLWRRSVIVVAGPLANFLLAIVLYWGIFVHGTDELRAIVDVPPAGTPAASAGFSHGERVLSVDGVAVDSWQDFRWALLKQASDNDRVRVEVINERREITTRVVEFGLPREAALAADFLEKAGFSPYRPKYPPIVGKVLAGSVAERAGFRAGDRIVMIGDEPIEQWRQVVMRVRSAAGRALDFGVQRGNESLLLKATPQGDDEGGRVVGRIGLQVDASGVPSVDMFTRVSYDPATAFQRALAETWEKSIFSLQMLGRMLTGEVSWRNLSGPVTIADYAGQSARLGATYYLKFLALVSISLGVLNLLPIPLLDGGHLLYYLFEAIKRGPLSERTMEIGQQVGLAILVLLMAFAFYNDINRLISG
jgi:regulator of sigma E protease